MKLFVGQLSMIVMFFLFTACGQKGKVTVVAEQLSPKDKFAVAKLVDALTSQGYKVQLADQPVKENFDRQIIVGTLKGKLLSEFAKKNRSPDSLAKEGFTIQSSEKIIYAAGADQSGMLYACMELADRLKMDGKLPNEINITDHPEMLMRGTCIGLQKTTYLLGRTVYEYPYTPENFPWFYDKALWIKYLDMLVENRYNSLYLWNGHPFASLVKLKDYPYAVEVDEATFKKNEEMFAFLTQEADKRGIFIIQMFYNIIVSKPFAEHNNMKTQDRERPIIPIIADYTQKSIAAFIEKYPNVGLLITLGEAMNTIDDDVEWFTKTILPGVKDGLKALGRTDEPPIVLRGHDTDAKRVMEKALPIYKNLYTMFKYNGESLTTYEPHDSWETIPKGLSELGTVHISNVHILANLEPFRYGSPDFIQKCVKAMHNIQGAKGVHVYPQASYWDWPYSADKTEPRELEMDRDWIWYQSWGRYAWNYHRDRKAEIEFWGRKLGDFYACGDEGKNILEAYEQTGEISPKLLRTFGISDGNRQSMLLGMFMAQLVNPQKYNVYSNFWNSSGPLKEVLQQYAEKEWKGEAHSGETPPQIIEDVVKRGQFAVESIDKAAKSVNANQEEFSRLKNDVYCYRAFANCFAEKVKAAMLILRYQYSKDLTDLEKAVPLVEKSVEYYTELVKLTENTYLYANSMQTSQRRIPITGANGTNKTWKELLPPYQAELNNFKRNVEMLKSKKKGDVIKVADAFTPAKVKILNSGLKTFPLQKGQLVYSDKDFKIEAVAKELRNLSGLQFSSKQQQDQGTVLRFENGKPVKVLAGYFNGNSYSILAPPTLETNAQANDRGQADIRIANALHIPGLYPVNVYTYNYPAGKNELVLGKGLVMILGFIDGDQEILIHDAGMGSNGLTAIDWLFY
ncbi:MAG: hypothetical protein NTY07_10525 [Bacteroidia bacterium]|nr:hypothetical protein [Bacteroidia bacterium]